MSEREIKYILREADSPLNASQIHKKSSVNRSTIDIQIKKLRERGEIKNIKAKNHKNQFCNHYFI